MDKINCILFLSGIGNAILLIPMLRELREREPKTRIEMVITQKVVKDMLEPEGLVDRFIIFDNNRKKGIIRYRIEQLRLICKLRKVRYDRVFLVGNEKMNLLLFSIIVRAKNKIGYSRTGKYKKILERLYNKTVDVRENVSEVELRLDLLKALGWDTQNKRPYLRLTDNERFDAQKRIDNIRQGRPILGIHAGSSEALAFKRWDVRKFAEFITYAYEIKGMQIVLFGGAGEEPIADEILSNVSFNVSSFVGKLTIRETIATIGNCNYFLSNDSGLMHVAAAMKVPQIALFGDTDIKKNCPQTDHSIIIDGKAMQSSGRRSIDNIRVHDVIAALEELVQKQGQ